MTDFDLVIRNGTIATSARAKTLYFSAKALTGLTR
jgi:hypothetical protein